MVTFADFLYNAYLSALAFAIGDFCIIRPFTAIYEIKFKRIHYPVKDQIWTILEYAYHQNQRARIVLLAMAMPIAFLFHYKELTELLTDLLGKCVNIIPIYIIMRIVNFSTSLIDQANWIRSGVGLDYATGMASNYFHGYINLQMADKGNETKGLRERLSDYESSEGVTVPIKRLFILIPDSLYVKPNFADPPRIEEAKPLEYVRINRGGCIKRPFKNSVYGIRGEKSGEKWYAAIEGATPLLSFYESMTNAVSGTESMVKMKREIALQFYKTLEKFAESASLRLEPIYDVIYYNDFTADGSPTDISELIRNRIIQLRAQGKD